MTEKSFEKPPEQCLPEPKNPPRLPPTMAIAHTARQLEQKWKEGQKKRNHDVAAAELTSLPLPPTKPSGP